jgi:predicted Rossmann fold nucleotide-binding protein DprA/Smf involved in DNA uptake
MPAKEISDKMLILESENFSSSTANNDYISGNKKLCESNDNIFNEEEFLKGIEFEVKVSLSKTPFCDYYSHMI